MALRGTRATGAWLALAAFTIGVGHSQVTGPASLG